MGNSKSNSRATKPKDNQTDDFDEVARSWKWWSKLFGIGGTAAICVLLWILKEVHNLGISYAELKQMPNEVRGMSKDIQEIDSQLARMEQLPNDTKYLRDEIASENRQLRTHFEELKGLKGTLLSSQGELKGISETVNSHDDQLQKLTKSIASLDSAIRDQRHTTLRPAHDSRNPVILRVPLRGKGRVLTDKEPDSPPRVSIVFEIPLAETLTISETSSRYISDAVLNFEPVDRPDADSYAIIFAIEAGKILLKVRSSGDHKELQQSLEQAFATFTLRDR